MELQHNVDLSTLNTFGLPARARDFIELNDKIKEKKVEK